MADSPRPKHPLFIVFTVCNNIFEAILYVCFKAKYYPCKQQCGFCIPGFQVYNISNKSVDKYGKDYGKKLTKEKIPEGK